MEESTYEPYNCADIIQRAVGINLGEDLDQLFIAPTPLVIKEKIDVLFRRLNLSTDELVITIAPYSSREKKDWPLNRYKELIFLLKARYSCQIIILGGPKDVGKSNFEGVHDLVGQTSLLEMAEILKRSNLFIGNCSGPLHIGAATGTPIIAIYGSTSSDHWAPRKNTIVVERKMACSPCDCLGESCIDYPCMQAIAVNDVCEACHQMILRTKQNK